MPNFKYKAITPEGEVLENTLVAPTEMDVIQELKKLNMVPIQVSQANAEKGKKKLKGKVKTKTLILFTKQLYTLLNAGIPIISSLNAIKEQTSDPYFKQIVETVINDVEQGSRFSDALAQFSKVFPPLYINSVKVGEVSGTLEDTLSYLHTYLEEEETIRKNVKKALRYPVIVVLGLISAFVVFVTIVIPSFIPIFEMSEKELPLPTKLLLGIYYLLSNYGFPILIGVVAIVVALVFYIKTPKGRFQFDKILLKLPILGELLQYVNISRFSKIFYTMNKTGIPVIQSLEILQDTMENMVFKKEIGMILERIKRGEGIANSLKQSPFFSTFVVEMISIGEKSGSLDEMLYNVSNYYDREVSEKVANMTSLIEPVVTVALGAMVLILALAIFLPMWDMMSLVQ